MHNFSPMIAIAVFGAAYLRKTKLIWWVPITATLLSDIALHYFVFPEFGFFYPGWVFQYVSYAVIIIFATGIFSRINLARITAGALGGAVIFFLISNFGSWLVLPEYTKNLSGLTQAYLMGIPFFKGTVLSTAIYSALLFGAYHLHLSLTHKTVNKAA